MILPRSFDRGLIEAMPRKRPLRQRSYFRDPLIAASLKRARGVAGSLAGLLGLPRSFDRGLIEADPSKPPKTGHGATSAIL